MRHTSLAVDEKRSSIDELNRIIIEALDRDGVVVLPPQDVTRTLALFRVMEYHFDTTMLDPWYNKGFGGVRDDYLTFSLDMIRQAGFMSDHVYFWGFPEIVAPFVERIPEPLTLVSWLIWYYKNSPSVIRGWRSSQNTCLHMAREGAILHPERFLTEKQLELKSRGKLRYMPGPTSVLDDDYSAPDDVIEHPLLVGFVGRSEQTGHPSRKPFKVYDKLMQMSMSDGGLILDPMCRSGTTGAVAKARGFRAILCDLSDEYTQLVEKRLGVRRLHVLNEIIAILGWKQ